MSKKIWITQKDRDRLLALIENPERTPDPRETAHLDELATELSRAEVYSDTDEVPADLITMRSGIQLTNLSTGSEMTCRLVYPGESDPEQNSISVLAPLGTAMLGHRVGDSFDVQLPRGMTKFRVEALTYQPEAAGDLHL